MSDTPETDVTEPTEDVTEDTTDAEETDAQEVTDDDAPDWRKDFDADKAAERIRKLQSEAKNLRTRAKDAEEKAKGADEKDTKISSLEDAVARYEVGYELGLPRELVDRLRGNTREELIEDAKALLELVKTPATRIRKPIEALRGGGEPEKEPEETDVRKIGERIFSR